MRKSSLILLLAMAFVLTTVVSGFSASVTEPCKECAKGWTYGLQIAYTPCGSPSQANPDPADCQCGFFDYELGSQGHCNDLICELDGGYCATQNVNGVVLKVCDCEDYSEFSSKDEYSIKIEIIEGDGVYFTNGNSSAAKLLDTNGDGVPDTPMYNCGFDVESCVAGDGDYVFVSSHKQSTKTTAYCLNPCPKATPVALSYAPVDPTQKFYTMCSQDILDDCCFECEPEYMVTAIQTCKAKILDIDEPVLLIDIPTFVYTPQVAKIGDTVKIKVTLVGGNEGGDVCVDCKELCSCIVEIGTFTSCPCVHGCTYCLPYLTSLDSSWWSGFAFTNASKTKAATATITFTAGNKSAVVYQSVPKGTVLTTALSAYADQLGAFDPAESIFANVTGIDQVFVIMGDNEQAYGYLGKFGNCSDCCTDCK